ncbi:hypothetical protein DAMA08_007290 [Martiniozyma asiatica (nom. inval.)]|nr:hypothetical protein DAMA08_007290 [Martiniozyma asiatica]
MEPKKSLGFATKANNSPDKDNSEQAENNANLAFQKETKRKKYLEANKKVDLDPYFSYNSDTDQLVTEIEITRVFENVQKIFGFQEDNMKNTLELFMSQLDSRASRFPSSQSLMSLHSDYIAGEYANYRKWYFCSFLETETDLIENINLKNIKNKRKIHTDLEDFDIYPTKKSQIIEIRWRQKYSKYSNIDYVYDLALYLMIWGEANNLRFVPEFLCFVFKCASDYLTFFRFEDNMKNFPQNDFLNRIITPLYEFYRDQQYKLINNNYVKRERDHQNIIGYDDINQLFWYYEGMKKIKIDKSTNIFKVKSEERYTKLGEIKWDKIFYKTYKENRSWWHLATNFNRIWIIHLNVFWYYSSFNAPSLYTFEYNYLLNNQPTAMARLSVVSLGSTIGCIIQFLAILFESVFVPKNWPGRRSIFWRLLCLFFVTAINFGPSIWILCVIPLNTESHLGFIIATAQFCVSILTTLYFAITPPAKLFDLRWMRRKSAFDPMVTFTSSYPKLPGTSRVISIVLWILVFGAKFIESYFFLTLSLRDPIRNLNIMDISRCHGDAIIGKSICKIQNIFVLVLMFLTDLILFFLDTYLWYIIWNCVISLLLSFNSGISMISPWRNVFTSLPTRIYSKLLATSQLELKYEKKNIVSQIWNAIIISMYREHLLSQDHVHKLIYTVIPNDKHEGLGLKEPSFFVYQNDNSKMSDYFKSNSEAERRISFFAQSMSTTIPEPIPIEAMPMFTVFIPHYGEKIILNLKEIIKQDEASKLSLLDYLKMMFPDDWKYFVTDTKILVLSDNKQKDRQQEISGTDTGEIYKAKQEDKKINRELDIINDLPLYCIGYKSSSPIYTLRTRIWASLRTQTLYRTISGFMNYSRAIKLLHRVENPEMSTFLKVEKYVDRYMDQVANRKFRLLVSMQRLQFFNDEEKENVDLMINTYKELKIASLLIEEDPIDGTKKYYSVLYEVQPNQNWNLEMKTSSKYELVLKYKILLSGNPILGDGKSDNQNMSIIYYRGEFIQVIDANQDNYIEECLKIRSVLAEFENIEKIDGKPYEKSNLYTGNSPVAILGAREYIFSENTGVLGDVAASKEQTFGTMFARTLSEIGGKLHYGHPDFLNGIFMTTRGGISKAQRGLHLNEDIYAGMMAICRGGKIKHCDYFQCGKGRDLGFSSVLNFTTKIGGGMGEQLLSREYWYLGTQMPLDRFLSFYYAHPGFHINNLFIIFSLHIFMLTVVNMGAMNYELIPCNYSKDIPFTELQIPIGCQNIQPVLDWVSRYVLSISICFFISFLPLVLHEFSERGIRKASSRLFMHFISLSPMFEVFVCQIYANSLRNDIVFGGARYISTGRGFSISRIPFVLLYSDYAPTSIYSGVRLFLMLLLATVTMWQPAILWFWIILISLILSPFVFNPHQFSWTDFFFRLP